jgi:hypothetical protein
MTRSRSGTRTVPTDAIARFQTEVQQLATAVARAVVEQELARRRAAGAAEDRADREQRGRATDPEAAPSRRRRSAKPPRSPPAVPRGRKAAAAPRPSAKQVAQLELLFTGTPARPGAKTAEDTTPPAEASVAERAVEATVEEPTPPQVPPAAAGKPGTWTREAITEELAKWLAGGTTVDAWFMKRYGPRGLVPAAVRIFGRFEVAMDVAALRVAALYPDGAPAKSAGDATRRAVQAVDP